MFGPFFKLSEAIGWQKGRSGLNLKIWSKEEENGKRAYFLASFSEFGKFYFGLASSERCFYELIGENELSKLYLDVEFSKEENPNLDGATMMQNLLSNLREFIQFQFHSVNFSLVDLESPYEHKFSRHCIFKNLVFRNNLQIGEFMRDFKDYLLLRKDREDVQMLFLANDKFVVDLGVYNKNRNFRLLLSSKKGKNSYLSPVVEGEETGQKALFFDSLVCHIDEGSTKILDYASKNEATSSNFQRNRSVGHVAESTCVPSPFPSVDRFVKEEILKESGFIRSAVYFSVSNRIVYNIGNYRFCANINRPHKSNGVYFVCDVKM
jgi:hypothetical protein